VIAQLDTPAGVYGQPGDAELARFLGESNLLEGDVRAGVAATRLGRLEVGSWTGAVGGGRARVLVRPEQIELGQPTGTMNGTVASYEYYGHDAVVRVRPELEGVPDLVVRVTGGSPLVPGTKVGLSVRGRVVAWPLDGRDPGENSE
jgi:ABC-type Fe3+/spermidine/putrescine transport system ATPase subunit